MFRPRRRSHRRLCRCAVPPPPFVRWRPDLPSRCHPSPRQPLPLPFQLLPTHHRPRSRPRLHLTMLLMLRVRRAVSISAALACQMCRGVCSPIRSRYTWVLTTFVIFGVLFVSSLSVHCLLLRPFALPPHPFTNPFPIPFLPSFLSRRRPQSEFGGQPLEKVFAPAVIHSGPRTFGATDPVVMAAASASAAALAALAAAASGKDAEVCT